MSGSHLLADIALRQTLDPGPGLSAFLSRVSMIGLAVAIGLLLAVQSVMNGFDREMRERILSLVPHVQISGEASSQEWDALRAELLAREGVSRVEPFAAAEALLLRGQSVTAARLTAIESDALTRYADLLAPAVAVWSPSDLVLGVKMAERLDVTVGDRVTFVLPAGATGDYRPLHFRVVSLLRSGTEIDEGLALVQQSAIPTLASQNALRGLAITLDDVFSAGEWRWDLIQWLPSNLRVTDWRATHGNLYSAIQLSRDLIGLILFTVIFVAAFNVVSALMLVVTDRRRVVAMLVAMGLKTRDVVVIFLMQGAIIGVVGSLAGMVLGYLLALGAPDMAVLLEHWLGSPLLQTDVYPLAFVPVDIRWQDFAATGAIATGLSVLAAVLPTLRASSLPVAATLSH